MQKSFLSKIKQLAKDTPTFELRTQQSLDWYRQKISNISQTKTQLDPNQVFDKKHYVNYPKFGNIVTFRYSPKTKNSLPYYDAFPLVLIINVVPQGFIGLNFHYLSPIMRAGFMEKLYDYQLSVSGGKNLPKIIINMKYEILKAQGSLFYYKACIKHYKKSQIKGMFYTLTPDEWDMALFLPTEKFIGEPKKSVWEKSKQIIKKV